MGKFLHIYIDSRNKFDISEIEKQMNLAVDWYRLDEKLYIVYTTSNISKWQERLIKFGNAGGIFFICQLDLNNRNGWMNKDFWEWLKKSRK